MILTSHQAAPETFTCQRQRELIASSPMSEMHARGNPHFCWLFASAPITTCMDLASSRLEPL